MAATEAKRAGGEKTGPGAGPMPMVTLEAALSGAIGSRVRIVTSAPTSATIEGTLFTACLITNLLAINTAASSQASSSANGNYTIIPITRVQSFNVVSLPTNDAASTFTAAAPSITALDIRALRVREANNVSKLQESETRRGKGVSKEAQDIFDAFARTMPVRWEGSSIVVSEDVVIAKPYNVVDCNLKPGVDNTAALTRVRKVLDMEKKKIELRNESTKFKSSVPNAANQRKGGR